MQIVALGCRLGQCGAVIQLSVVLEIKYTFDLNGGRCCLNVCNHTGVEGRDCSPRISFSIQELGNRRKTLHGRNVLNAGSRGWTGSRGAGSRTRREGWHGRRNQLSGRAAARRPTRGGRRHAAGKFSHYIAGQIAVQRSASSVVNARDAFLQDSSSKTYSSTGVPR